MPKGVNSIYRHNTVARNLEGAMETYGQDFYQKDSAVKRLWRVGWGLVLVCAMTAVSQCVPQEVQNRIFHAAVHAVDTTPRPLIK